MITGLDHVVLLAGEDEASDYFSLLGRSVVDQYTTDDGRRVRGCGVANTSIEVMSPMGSGAGSDRLNDLISGGTRFASLAFATDNLESAHRTAERRGLNPSDITMGQRTNVFRCDDTTCGGVKTFIVRSNKPMALDVGARDEVTRLDHLVINTPNPERALAHYGARLGLRLALDRPMPEFGARMIFFKAGDITIEIIHRLGEDHDPTAVDRLWGLSWEVDDLTAVHARLSENGTEVSDIRVGRKPGTEVFTVKSRTLDVPTLFIGKTPR